MRPYARTCLTTTALVVGLIRVPCRFKGVPLLRMGARNRSDVICLSTDRQNRRLRPLTLSRGSISSLKFLIHQSSPLILILGQTHPCSDIYSWLSILA